LNTIVRNKILVSESLVVKRGFAIRFDLALESHQSGPGWRQYADGSEVDTASAILNRPDTVVSGHTALDVDARLVVDNTSSHCALREINDLQLAADVVIDLGGGTNDGVVHGDGHRGVPGIGPGKRGRSGSGKGTKGKKSKELELELEGFLDERRSCRLETARVSRAEDKAASFEAKFSQSEKEKELLRKQLLYAVDLNKGEDISAHISAPLASPSSEADKENCTQQ